MGTIVDFRQRVLSEDDRDRTRESSALTTVRIKIHDAGDPQVVLKEFQVRDRAEFFLARGETLATAQSESFFDLARKIVNGLEQELPRSARALPYDEPAEEGELYAWLAKELGAEPPRLAEEGEVQGDDRRRSAGSKRCSNRRARQSGYRFRYPTFREGYAELLRAARSS